MGSYCPESLRACQRPSRSRENPCVPTYARTDNTTTPTIVDAIFTQMPLGQGHQMPSRTLRIDFDTFRSRLQDIATHRASIDARAARALGARAKSAGSAVQGAGAGGGSKAGLVVASADGRTAAGGAAGAAGASSVSSAAAEGMYLKLIKVSRCCSKRWKGLCCAVLHQGGSI